MLRQARILDSVIQEFIEGETQTILDVSCGIGTQSIGLAKKGYQVAASDISIKAIEQAKKESTRHKVEIEFQVVDMRMVWEEFQKQFDILIACDNSIPHLQTNDEIFKAFKQFYKCIRPGGGCIVTVRNYSEIDREPGTKMMYPRLVHPMPDGQIILFDVWDFYTEDHYEITIYLIEDRANEIRTKAIRGGKYYCVGVSTLEKLFLDAGFRNVKVMNDRFFQPLILALK